jgi:hypothetical protein
MRFRKQCIGVAIATLMAFTAYAQNPPQGSKGFELYSWKENGRWHYSLLAGTNRAKSYEEITSKQGQLVGTDALKAELKKLPKGDEVFWRSAAHPGIAKPRSKDAPILELPSRKRIKRIRNYCAEAGIKLTLI